MSAVIECRNAPHRSGAVWSPVLRLAALLGVGGLLTLFAAGYVTSRGARPTEEPASPAVAAEIERSFIPVTITAPVSEPEAASADAVKTVPIMAVTVTPQPVGAEGAPEGVAPARSRMLSSRLDDVSASIDRMRRKLERMAPGRRDQE